VRVLYRGSSFFNSWIMVTLNPVGTPATSGPVTRIKSNVAKSGDHAGHSSESNVPESFVPESPYNRPSVMQPEMRSSYRNIFAEMRNIIHEHPVSARRVLIACPSSRPSKHHHGYIII
jgi:hypothetical protein